MSQLSHQYETEFIVKGCVYYIFASFAKRKHFKNKEKCFLFSQAFFVLEIIKF